MTEPMPVGEIPAIIDCLIPEVQLGITINEDVRSYEWSGPMGGLSSTTDANPFAMLPGTYTVVVTADDNGCSRSIDIVVDQDMDVPVVATAATEITCANPVADLIGDGSTPPGASISYQWLDPNGAMISDELNTTTDMPGEHTLIVSNSSNSCVEMMTVMVPVDLTEPTADAGDNVPFPCGVTEVTISGSGTGQASLSYEWFNSCLLYTSPSPRDS